MRNTNKYTKLYSGGTPTFVEDNIFEIVIPMDNVADLQVGPNGADNEKVPVKSASKKVPVKSASKNFQQKTLQQFSEILDYLQKVEVCQTVDLCEVLSVKDRRVRQLLKDLEEEGKIEAIGSYRNRQYKLIDKKDR